MESGTGRRSRWLPDSRQYTEVLVKSGAGLAVPHQMGFREVPFAVQYIRTDLIGHTPVGQVEEMLDGTVAAFGLKRAYTLRLSKTAVDDHATHVLSIVDPLDADVVVVPDLQTLGIDALKRIRRHVNVIAGRALFSYTGYVLEPSWRAMSGRAADDHVVADRGEVGDD